MIKINTNLKGSYIHFRKSFRENKPCQRYKSRFFPWNKKNHFTLALALLIRTIRSLFSLISKTKATKLVRTVAGLFSDTKVAVNEEVTQIFSNLNLYG
jgi:hypothetical protein